MIKYLFQIAGFFPLFVFVDVYIITSNWLYAFVIGGILALMQISLFLYKNLTFDRFMLAINLFLIIGAIGLGLHISWIENLYDQLMQTTLFVFLLLVGLATTLLSEHGFIDIRSLHDKKIIRRKSLYLVLATAIATVFSYFFKGSIIISGLLPFAGLIAIRKFLIKK